MNVLKVYESLPPDVKLKMLEDKVMIMLDIINEIHLANKKGKLMEDNSDIKKSFYRKYYQLFNIDGQKE